MVRLTLDECKAFMPTPIDYDNFEMDKRVQEELLLLSFMFIRLNEKEHELCLKSYNPDLVYPLKLFFVYEQSQNRSLENFLCNPDTLTSAKEALRWYKTYNDDFDKRIEGLARRLNLEKEFVFYEAINNSFLLKELCRDPKKQTIHQKLAAKWISEIPFISGFDEPINRGVNAMYVSSGQVLCGKAAQGQKTGKSIDFIWDYTFKEKTLKFYATHKFTRQTGGSQDNQFEDVCIFHEQARNCINDDVVFLSITDGDYYLLKYTKHTDAIKQELNHIEFLNELYGGKHNVATRSIALVSVVVPIIIKWLERNFLPEDITNEIEKLNIIKSNYETAFKALFCCNNEPGI